MDHGDCPAVSSMPSDPQQRTDGRMLCPPTAPRHIFSTHLSQSRVVGAPRHYLLYCRWPLVISQLLEFNSDRRRAASREVANYILSLQKLTGWCCNKCYINLFAIPNRFHNTHSPVVWPVGPSSFSLTRDIDDFRLSLKVPPTLPTPPTHLPTDRRPSHGWWGLSTHWPCDWPDPLTDRSLGLLITHRPRPVAVIKHICLSDYATCTMFPVIVVCTFHFSCIMLFCICEGRNLFGEVLIVMWFVAGHVLEESQQINPVQARVEVPVFSYRWKPLTVGARWWRLHHPMHWEHRRQLGQNIGGLPLPILYRWPPVCAQWSSH